MITINNHKSAIKLKDSNCDAFMYDTNVYLILKSDANVTLNRGDGIPVFSLTDQLISMFSLATTVIPVDLEIDVT